MIWGFHGLSWNDGSTLQLFTAQVALFEHLGEEISKFQGLWFSILVPITMAISGKTSHLQIQNEQVPFEKTTPLKLSHAKISLETIPSETSAVFPKA